MNNYAILGVFVAFACVMVVGNPDFCCAAEPEVGQAHGAGKMAPQEMLAHRAAARWAALSAGDLKSAYEFESPGYRETVPYDQYAKQFGAAVRWQGADVRSVKLDHQDSVAAVRLVLRYTAPSLHNKSMPMARGIKETWIKSAGTWWFLRE